MKKILVIGATGQIGSELTPALKKRYGEENIVLAYYYPPLPKELAKKEFSVQFDVRDIDKFKQACIDYNIDTIINLAAILSAKGEQEPLKAWDTNINGLINTLEIANELKLERVFVPSSIAVFGPTTPRINTPQDTILQPTTMYGITKVSGELLGNYYFMKFGVDIRGIRYPGIISSMTLPGGGTTDYAVEIFYEAVKNKYYNCFLKADTRLPMMYMADCIKATIMLLEADINNLKHHSGFNVTAMSFTPEELANEIKKYIPDFKIDYNPDFRQAIADSWPQSIDDSCAREEWGWQPDYDLAKMTKEMLIAISKKLQIPISGLTD
ncbi:MAG: NAD-dependent epimerase/dehydratase family protein [Bacteroidales bacterium]|jgi:nucleoside-diphosphate-sugar epimerase|nr:NAD-dependent epimerase/dehydratase family protein [Bacteroidales bacterium]MDI9576365.1 NAD-dependent epimerase/dehydratase family protein [Bacteroidota bacterium]MDD2593557.1 NAD-dependent epimerase/dehydratase family protein [Bacteroidales bacterium]MDD3755124.1 NAD-dependent epimerase/dehydratase family protein [Bacteroidales bacterium]MDY0400640.1 NAD-dependent epimerase/dehydratase family protein [Bacteroidales bacterium]